MNIRPCKLRMSLIEMSEFRRLLAKVGQLCRLRTTAAGILVQSHRRGEGQETATETEMEYGAKIGSMEK